MRTTVLMLGLAAGACSIQEDNFPETAGRAMCDQRYSCDRATSEQTWADRADCEADMSVLVDEWWVDLADFLNCTYDASAAGECVRAIRAQPCVDYGTRPPECKNVYQCGGGS